MDFHNHEPPFEETYKTLLLQDDNDDEINMNMIIENCDLPIIDLSRLLSCDDEREKCRNEIIDAATKWGLFHIVNHGISKGLFDILEKEQKKLFNYPFQTKSQERFLNLMIPNNSYRWGNSKATCLNQIIWSEAFHLSDHEISTIKHCNNLRLALERFANVSSMIAKTLSEILAEKIGLVKANSYFQEKCPKNSSYIRLNRYPSCPHSSSKLIFGLIPHTDTDFITLVHQDSIGGLQLLRDGKWFGVKPNPDALIINIGDLFQVLSNGIYKSVKHRVIASKMERFSCAYFYCPSDETIVESLANSPPIYRKFSFLEYKEKTKKDVEETGEKVGLQRFLLK